MKKIIACAAAAGITAALLVPPTASADSAKTVEVPNPVISRNVPAYSSVNPATACAGNDDYYYSFWNGAAPEDYLAYDLSGVPEAQRQIIDAVWYNTSAYDTIGMYSNRNMEPSDYTIEVNAAQGGDYPEDGWEIIETVTGNTLSSRQHLVDFAGYNWIRLHITGVDGKTSGTCMVNFDIHDVSNGICDSWLFLEIPSLPAVGTTVMERDSPPTSTGWIPATSPFRKTAVSAELPAQTEETILTAGWKHSPESTSPLPTEPMTHGATKPVHKRTMRIRYTWCRRFWMPEKFLCFRKFPLPRKQVCRITNRIITP